MKQQQPYTIEAEYYPDGTQKRYCKKVEKDYPQVFQFVLGLCAIATALSLITIIFYLPQDCRENYNQTPQSRLPRGN